MVSDVIPAAIDRSVDLDGKCHLGQAASLSSFQKDAKKAWRLLAVCRCSGKDYGMDIGRWVCQCGTQQLQAHHFCKHLVQAVLAQGPLPSKFFNTLVWHHTMPIYKIPHLNKDGHANDEGSISDGDEVWTNGRKDLGKGAWRSESTQVLTGNIATLKRSRTLIDNEEQVKKKVS